MTVACESLPQPAEKGTGTLSFLLLLPPLLPSSSSSHLFFTLFLSLSSFLPPSHPPCLHALVLHPSLVALGARPSGKPCPVGGCQAPGTPGRVECHTSFSDPGGRITPGPQGIGAEPGVRTGWVQEPWHPERRAGACRQGAAQRPSSSRGLSSWKPTWRAAGHQVHRLQPQKLRLLGLWS